MTTKAIFIRDFSEESEKTENLLKEKDIDYVVMISNSSDTEPTLITLDGNFSYLGFKEISDYANSMSKSKLITNF